MRTKLLLLLLLLVLQRCRHPNPSDPPLWI
jgi:hypothetical protein